eukprot:CAMPEP_0179494628 /NCGR_PEP_ID=MMETSP0799-20121207/68278_1 /TAXON_ID=46947 /ORGANISM="Geminigera cryophila, Strain CCMP2564" /LENGTH=207 /DNA_ID=CAMNT_0021312269 /DNA_START=527 /DNA_END=1150 /DNA_ORIENTATION=+
MGGNPWTHIEISLEGVEILLTATGFGGKDKLSKHKSYQLFRQRCNDFGMSFMGSGSFSTDSAAWNRNCTRLMPSGTASGQSAPTKVKKLVSGKPTLYDTFAVNTGIFSSGTQTVPATTSVGGTGIVQPAPIQVKKMVCRKPAPVDSFAVKFGEYFSGELLVTGSPILEYVHAAVDDDSDSAAVSGGVVDKQCVKDCVDFKDLEEYRD